MADYYPLIARAVAGLEKNTGDARRALYERARSALVAQLRSVTPALSENDVTRERLALEESIRKVEAEAARRSHVDPPHSTANGRVRAPQFPRWEPPAPSASALDDAPPRPGSTRGEMLRPSSARMPRASNGASSGQPAAASLAESTRLAEPRYADPVFDEPLPPDHTPEDAPATPRNSGLHSRPSSPSPDRGSLLDAGLKDFRDVVSEKADDTGDLPLRSRSSRDSYPAPSPAHDFDRLTEPQAADLQPHEFAPPPPLEEGAGYDEPAPAPARGRGRIRDGEVSVAGPGRIRQTVKAAAAIVILAGIGSALAWQWPNIAAVYKSTRTPAATEVAHKETPKEGPKKIPDRLEQGGPQASSVQPTSLAAVPTSPLSEAAVAQKVVLYEEDPAEPQGRRYVGSAIWRTERVPAGPGQPPEVAIRADVEIPDRKLAMTWSLRRNNDQSLPATHTVEIMFRLPQDFAPGGVSNVPGILMKQTEQTRGVPLAGLAVKVTNGFFLIGLSAAEADKERNVQMLKERQWFDIPVVYSNNRRAILAVEKGTPGERVFAEAFAAWRQ